jgi:hypothetical protein
VRVVIITSCTGEKVVHHERALTLEDFQKGAAHIAAREDELANLRTPAEELYSGQQHVRLMRGLRTFRSQCNDTSSAVDLWILSAGYGGRVTDVHFMVSHRQPKFIAINK